MDKSYSHSQWEGEIYKQWEDGGSFRPEVNTDGKPFTIIMPPPNANDPLHVGHAMFVSVEDILIRYHRMKGDKTLWLPGTDHAGIETQYVFEKKLAKEGKSRFNFDRETLYQKIWDYVHENSDTSVGQMKKLGASADWSRFTFTLDEKVVDQVLDTFIKLHNDGLIYHDERLVNYSPKSGTSYSELEIEYEDKTSPLYYVKYRMEENPEEFVSVATVRPEPIFADTHLAVNPNDESKKYLIGKFVLNPLTEEKMEIIGDEFVDPEFGTGVVKLTPAHDHNDWEVAKKYNLPIRQAINTDGRITPSGGKYAGMKVKEAREAVVADLQAKGLIEKIDEKYQNRVAVDYKTGDAIEPLPLPQWFVKVEPLAAKALEALKNKETVVLGSGHDKILKHWLENLRDWNISRQIVWGIRIPVWYDIDENPDMTVGFLTEEGKFVRGVIKELLESYSLEELKKGLQTLITTKDAKYIVSRGNPGERFLQETDTFDTWFSSGQWPVVTLKAKSDEDLAAFYPTNVMETAYDILIFWVMRMMLLGIYLTGKSPFSHVYLHGLIRDEKGLKMSKSKGNAVNPLELVGKYGADALRMALVMSSSAGLDSAVGESKVKGMRNFANKIWNAGRFIKMMRDGELPHETSDSPALDSEFEEKLTAVVKEVTQLLDKLKVGLAAEVVHNEFWHWFCDECIEHGKQGKISLEKLEMGLEVFLKLLHPFMPFVTEAVWSALGKEKLLIVSEWPGRKM